MKALVISDIHGNIDALNAVWEKESDCDIVLCPGDIVDYGFNPHEVVQWFINLKKPYYIVAGNHEHITLNRIHNGIDHDETSPVNFGELTALRLSSEDIQYLEALPEQADFKLDGITCCMRHSITEHHEIKKAYIGNQMNNIFNELWNKYRTDTDISTRRFILGHYHQSIYSRIDGCRDWFDPGSLSYRTGGDPVYGANYAVIIDGEVILRYTDFPREHLRRMVDDHPTLTERGAGHTFW